MLKDVRKKYVEILKVQCADKWVIEFLESGAFDLFLDRKIVESIYKNLNTIKQKGKDAYLNGQSKSMLASFNNFPDAKKWWHMGFEEARKEYYQGLRQKCDGGNFSGYIK